MASSALASVRAAADLARRDPTEANVKAVRTAIAAVAHRHRLDGAGAHKERPSSEARALLAEAKVAAALARKNPSAINVKAAKVATARAAEAGAQVHIPNRPSRTDAADDITADDLDALADLDIDKSPWTLPTEDDGGSLDESADADLRQDSRWDDGGNPNHDAKGRFAAGSHSGRPWRLAFDAREHQKTIDAHAKAEAVYRAKSLQIGQRMAELKTKAEAASPKERAALKRRYESLSAKRDEHRTAATTHREARVQVGKDLEAARAAHAEQRRSAVAQRTEASWDRKRAEAESFMAIGTHRIGGSEGHAAVEPVGGGSAPRARVTEADAHAAAQRGRAEAEARSGALRTQQERAALEAKLGVGKATPDYSNRRQVVTYAEPKRTQGEWNLHEQLQRETRQASDARAEARNRAGSELPPAAHAVLLPPAHVVTKAHKYLAGILGR